MCVYLYIYIYIYIYINICKYTIDNKTIPNVHYQYVQINSNL